MRRLLIGVLTLAGVLTAAATVQWWTPADKDCPSFTSEAACRAYCVQNPARCGGSSDCIEHAGPTPPGC